MNYKDPFLGEMQLKKLGESSRHGFGEHVLETIYIDDLGNFYIYTSTIDIEHQTINVIPKQLFDRITELLNSHK